MGKEKLLLLGDEAFAQGAIDAGMSGAYAYPGTPSTEIMEYIQKNKEAIDKKIHSKWSANEKTAVESSLGMSYAGKRTISCMKHVGLNVAADAFVNSAITGANGGMIVAVADDPSMHSSQNEQDSRALGKFAFMPMLEPTNQQECYDMAAYGFEISEKFEIPILLRLTTRIAHSRAGIDRNVSIKENEVKLPTDPLQFILLPSVARGRYRSLLERQDDFEKESENSIFNKYINGSNKSLGIIACGITYNYFMENFGDKENNYPLLKVSQYPLPRKHIEKMFNECDEILVLEDGAPFVEEQLRGYLNNHKVNIRGRLDGSLPRDGELNPNLVAVALGFKDTYGTDSPEILEQRPPQLCQGCGHVDFYNALNESVKDVYGDGHVFSDIGCYTLAALPPFESINSCVDMGASITMAKGASDAGLFPAIAVIGDSTFAHSGMTGLLDCVIENTNIVIAILDNSITGMTGQQESHAFGRIEQILKGIGVEEDHIRIFNPVPKNHAENVQIMKEEIEYDGLSVIVPTRECVHAIGKLLKIKANLKKLNK